MKKNRSSDCFIFYIQFNNLNIPVIYENMPETEILYTVQIFQRIQEFLL